MPSMYIKELALLVKLSPRRLYQINEELEPDKKLFVREDGTKADLATFVQRWVEYRESLVRGSAEMTLEEAKTRHELIKTEKTRFEVKRLQGEMVFASDVIALGQEIVGGVKNNLLHIPTTLAPVLCNMDDAEEIESVLTQAIREALEDMSRLETWQPPDVDPGTLEDEEDEEDRKWENECSTGCAEKSCACSRRRLK